jgi:hypothetical protein
MKKRDRRRVQLQPRNRTRKWLREHFQKIGFVDRQGQPQDVVVAGLGLVEIKENR